MSANHQKQYNGIIIFGEMGTGKDLFADLLMEADKRCCKYNIGNVIRQFFSIIKVNPYFRGKNRFLGQILADKLREIHPDILNDYCLSLIYEKWQNIFGWNNDALPEEAFHDALLHQLSQIKEKEIPLIVGGRTAVDFEYWTNKNFLTIGIVCSHEIRYARLCQRDGEEVAKNSNFKHNTEIEVGNIAEHQCKIVVRNEKDLIHLKNEAAAVLNNF